MAAVIAFHFGAPLPGGFLGVDLFFVISGFVITRMLVSEYEGDAGVGYGRFLARRVRRLLPVLVVVLACTFLWLYTTSDALQRSGDKQIVAAAGYVSNWFAIFGNQSYWDVRAELTPLNHLWSLSVEEQFCLVWPWLLVLVVRFLPKRPAGAGRARIGRSRIRFGVLDRHGARGSGVLGYGHAGRGTAPRSRARVDPREIAAPGACLPAIARNRDRGGAAGLLVFAAACAIGWTVESPALYSGGLLVVGLAEVALVWSVVQGGSLARFFGSRVIRTIGRASYSIYLWHWIVWVALRNSPLVPEAARPVVALAVTAALSVVTYRFVEVPLRKKAPRAVVACSLIALVVLAAAAFAAIPSEPVG